jgi:hypothetical protein
MLRALGVALAVSAVLAAPAFAHKGNPNYESRVLSAPAGVTVDVLNRDDRLELQNRGRTTVLIRGYEGEPYARIRPNGEVEVNTRSPATYLNEDRYAGVKVPASANADAPPAWKRLDGSGRFEWHDHRMHWMGKGRPDKVEDPGKKTKIFDWKVAVDTGGNPGLLRGDLYWIPKDDGGPPTGAIGAFVALLLAAAGLVLVVRRRRGGGGGASEAW